MSLVSFVRKLISVLKLHQLNWIYDA